MHPDSWEKVQQLFKCALQKNPEQRQAFLLDACGDDTEIYQEVLSLLAADSDSESILEGAAIDAVKTNFFDDFSDAFSVAGKQIGQYKLLKRIATGGMGAVYLAERIDGQFQHKVAVKLIKPGMDSEQIIRRFKNERQILANLDHPNIAQLLDGGLMDGNLPYFTMEYVEGEPIDIYCNKNKLSIKDRIRLFRTVCDAVQYAHRNLVVHRDLKPSNIMVTRDGKVKLLDFGIAKVFGQEEDVPHLTALTQPGLKVMTPEYASPEQIQGKPVTTLTDVYSLGLILYQLLTGKNPFDFSEKSPAAIEKMICEEKPVKPSTVVNKIFTDNVGQENNFEDLLILKSQYDQSKIKKELKGDLDTICLMALRKEPERRYGSPEQIIEDINSYLSGRPINALRDSVTYRSRKFVQRHKTSVIAAIISFTIINTLVLYYTFQLATERDRAQLEAKKSAQVSNFLINLFEVSDPSESRGETITARELLDTGTDRIESELKEQPGIQAELYNVVGKVYMSLGLHVKSQRLFEKALDLNQNAFGENSREMANTLNFLGELNHFTGEYETSSDYYNKSISIYENLSKEYEGEISEVIFNKASVVHEMGDYQMADSLYRKSIWLRERIFGDQSQEVAESLSGLAKLLNDQADYKNSEKIYKKALQIKRATFGNLHPSVTQTLVDLGYLYEVVGNWSESERLFREALALDIKILGEDHPNITSNWFSLGSLLHNMGKYEDAEYYLKKALEGDIKNFGINHPYVALDKNNLAGVLNAKDNLEEAEKLYRAARKTQIKALGHDHPEVATTTSNLGMLFLKKGLLDSAETYSKKALQIRKKILGEEHPHVSISMNHLANVYFKMKDYEKAEPLYVGALQMQRRMMGKDNRRVVVPMLSLASFRVETGDTLQAEKILREAVNISKEAYPESHPTISNTLYELGELLLYKGNFVEAENIIMQSLNIRSKVYGSDHKSVIAAKTLMGKCWIGMKKYSKAENILLDCFSKFRDEDQTGRKKVVDQILNLYTKWEKPNQAKEFKIYLN